MAKKRPRKDRPEPLRAPSVSYSGGPDGLEVDLRAAMTIPSRARYHEELHDLRRSTDDSWQRALEFLWEQLGTRWAMHDVELTKRKELLGRYRMASAEERRFVRESLRTHLAEYFPEMERP